MSFSNHFIEEGQYEYEKSLRTQYEKRAEELNSRLERTTDEKEKHAIHEELRSEKEKFEKALKKSGPSQLW